MKTTLSVIDKDVGVCAPVRRGQGDKVYRSSKELRTLAPPAQGAWQGRPLAPPDVPHGPGVVGPRTRYHLEIFNFDINDI